MCFFFKMRIEEYNDRELMKENNVDRNYEKREKIIMPEFSNKKS